MLRDGELLIETTSGQEVCAAASFAKSSGSSCGCAGTAAMSGSTELLFSVGGNGFAESLLAWRSAFERAIAGGLIPTAAAAEIEPDTEPEAAAAEPEAETTAAEPEPETTAVGAEQETAAAETEAELVGGHESVSATTLELPEVCLRSEVNSARNERCRCCRFDHGGKTLVVAETNVLWSVRIRNLRPSRRKRKCRTDEEAANNSRSNVEKRTWVGVNFCEKNANGRHALFSSCWRTPPTCESDASTAKASVAPGAGWESSTVATRAALAAVNASAAEAVHSSVFGLPRNRSVRGWSVAAILGRNLR